MRYPEWTMWNAFIEIGDVTIPCEAFYPTLDMSEFAGQCTAGDKIRGLQGLVMRVRRGTYFVGYGVETRRTLSGNQNNHLVVIVSESLEMGLESVLVSLKCLGIRHTNYGQRLLAHSKTNRQKIQLI